MLSCRGRLDALSLTSKDTHTVKLVLRVSEDAETPRMLCPLPCVSLR